MPVELRVTDQQWDRLRAHLLRDGDEHAALLVCGVVVTSHGTVLVTRYVRELGGADLLDSSALHLSVAPVTLARAAKAAAREGLTLVLCHSHPWRGSVAPSSLDLNTEADLCGRVLPGRLSGRPAGALVVGPDDVSGRLWDGPSPPARPQPMQLRVVGEQTALWPEPPAAVVPETTARQVLAWGGLGQNRLARARVIVVGTGGTGSHVAIQLAHLGVGSLVLIDHDCVERTNLSRLVGATPRDIGRRKVDVLAAAARRANSDVSVATVSASVLDIDPHLLAGADVIVCATDGHGSRALLTEVAQQYLVPVVDLGVEVVPTAQGVQAGGQVRVLRPGRGCLHCAGTLDPALVREEYLSDEERAAEAERGYLRGVRAPAPAVIALNGVLASLAVLEVCQLLAGFLGSAADRLLFRAHRRALTTAGITGAADCFACGQPGLLGLGDARALPVRRTAPAHLLGD